MKIYFVTVLVLLLFISGCGPIYETTSTYVKPDNSEGVACTFQCENSRLRCEQNLELKRQNCNANDRIAELEYQQCVDKKGKKKCDRSWVFCEINTASCKATYNQCYTSCGGEVTTKTICVEGCEG